MPELPEVETIMQRLRDGTPDSVPVPGQIIKEVEVNWNKIVEEPSAEQFKSILKRKTIKNAKRRGKFLHFPLNEGHLIAHLRMSGDMKMEKRMTNNNKPVPEEQYDQVVINFETAWRMIMSSVRKFSRVWYVTDPQTVLGNLGPEPLGPNLNPDILYQMLQKHHRQIKPLLMDQTFIAGLGNIYTDEILFQARIHPLQISNTLTKAEAAHLYDAMQIVLNKAIEKLGSSLDWVYRSGEFQNYFKVHRREGEPCPGCSGTIKKITVGERSTYYCPSCQILHK
jgi:formamidopyrimidine-DNA glycosylase